MADTTLEPRPAASTAGSASADARPAPPPASPVPADLHAEPAASAPRPKSSRRRVILGIIILALIVITIIAIPKIHEALTTVSTDDAYVNGHVTFVAPRVGGQVTQVLVDDNNRVRKGDLIVELDKQPYQVAVNIKQAAVETAKSDVDVAIAQVRASEALARSLRWKLQHSMEDVQNQIALLNTYVAALDSAEAVAKRAKADLDRAMPLARSGAVASEEIDRRTQVLAVAEAQVKQSLEAVYQVRASLGLPAKAAQGDNLSSVPADLVETFSSVRQAQAELMQAAYAIGVVYPIDRTPKEMLADFLKRDPTGDIDKIYAKLLQTAPVVIQARQKLQQAQRDLDQANLNLSYCNVYAEIDGVVTRRNVNPGNNVVSGQELMAIRSVREIWVDANFKETELAHLRIGLPVDLYLDMYGKHQSFKGRISGFTMGTGSTLALLPAQNATGNFVKVVQRLPVRIDFENYDPDKDPLFVGLSVEPVVRYTEQPAGPDAGKILQPFLPLPTAPADSAAARPEATGAPADAPADAPLTPTTPSVPATTQPVGSAIWPWRDLGPSKQGLNSNEISMRERRGANG